MVMKLWDSNTCIRHSLKAQYVDFDEFGMIGSRDVTSCGFTSFLRFEALLHIQHFNRVEPLRGQSLVCLVAKNERPYLIGWEVDGILDRMGGGWHT